MTTLDVRPICHFTPMQFENGEDECYSVAWWECMHCGHTKEISREWSG